MLAHEVGFYVWWLLIVVEDGRENELGYITFIGYLYYFNVLNVKVKNGILGEFEIGMLK